MGNTTKPRMVLIVYLANNGTQLDRFAGSQPVETGGVTDGSIPGTRSWGLQRVL